MSSERLFTCILVPFIVAVIYIVWKEANEVNAPKPAASAAPAAQVDQAPVPQVITKAVEGAAFEDVPKDRSAEDADIITHAKDAPVSMLDPSLPHESADHWLAHTAGSAARIRWDVNDCPGADKEPDSTPVCAQADIEFANGTRFQTLILLGEKPMKPPGPVQYGQPSVLWAAYQKARGALTPAELASLHQIAQQAN